VFDQISSRDKPSNFANFQLELESVLDKGSDHMLVWPSGYGLAEKEVDIGMVLVKDSNFGRNLNRFLCSFWFQTFQALIDYNLFLSVVERL
jgi:hypothetical protein